MVWPRTNATGSTRTNGSATTQGGPTGYEPRDFLADFESDSPVEVHQAFAWNPSVTGAKSEDTTLAGNDGPEILTADACWPSRIVAGLPRPLVLER